LLNKSFRAKLQKNTAKGGWTFVIWPESVRFFGTRGLVLGDGRHKLPVRADIRQAIGKQAGDTVTVLLLERMSNK